MLITLLFVYFGNGHFKHHCVNIDDAENTYFTCKLNKYNLLL